MCVTAGEAQLGQTLAFTYATLLTEDPRTEHISGYQTTAVNLESTPNMMLLHYPGDDIQLVRGPEDTEHLMQDLTSRLPALGPVMRGGGAHGARVEQYGDYYVVLAESAADILEVLEQVPEQVRPRSTREVQDLIEFYGTMFPSFGFVLACWDRTANPRHPIVVKYVPHNDDILFVPGLEAHDGSAPIIGGISPRNFRVAFAADGHPQPIKVDYTDEGVDSDSCIWAPNDVTGFFDNRRVGDNHDYVVPLETIMHGYFGEELFQERII